MLPIRETILGYDCSHNKSAAIIKNNKLINAIEEERLSRIKYSPNLLSKPDLSINYLLQNESSLQIAPIGEIDHHLAHAHSTYPLSGFDKASVLIMDGMGDDDKFFRSISLYRGEGRNLTLQHANYMPYSLGCYYALFTELFFNFGILEDGKTMGLSSYGTPENKYYQALKEIVYLRDNQINFDKNYFRFILNESYYKCNKTNLDRFFQSINLDFPIEIKKHYMQTYPEIHLWHGMSKLHLEKFCYYKNDFDIFQNIPCFLAFKDSILDVFGEPRRINANPTQRHMDVAWAVQKRLEDAIFMLVSLAKSLNPDANKLCMAGGVALNCVANAKIYNSNIFDEIYVQPAAADCGLAIGRAVYKYTSQNNVNVEPLKSIYLGHSYADDEIESLLKYYSENKVIRISKFIDNSESDVIFYTNNSCDQLLSEKGYKSGHRIYFDIPFSEFDTYIEYYFDDQESVLTQPLKFKINLLKIHFNKSSDICAHTAALLKRGKIIAWFQGAAEFGPRALGHRSILTAPFPASMKDILNEKVKHRENFRPFACSILEEKVADYFELPHEGTSGFKSPYMLFAFQAKRKALIDCPAVIHVDNTCRIQTINATHENGDERFYKLIKAFERLTSVPVLLNTSFNVAGQPIVETPYDALYTFLSTEIDILVMHDYIISKNQVDLK